MYLRKTTTGKKAGISPGRIVATRAGRVTRPTTLARVPEEVPAPQGAKKQPRTRSRQKAGPEVVAPGPDMLMATLTDLQAATGGIMQRLEQLEARQARSEALEQSSGSDVFPSTRTEQALPGATTTGPGG